MPHFFRRFAETVAVELVTSLVFALPFYLGILEQSFGNCVALMLLCFLANLFWLVICLKGYLLSFYSLREYYLTNMIVILVLTVLSMVFAIFNIEPFFTLLFLPFKLLNITLGVSEVISALVINLIFLIMPVIVDFHTRRSLF